MLENFRANVLKAARKYSYNEDSYNGEFFSQPKMLLLSDFTL